AGAALTSVAKGCNLCENSAIRQRLTKQHGGLLSHHPARTTLQRFLLGGLTASEVPPVVQHLIGGCVRCRQLLKPFAEAALPQPAKSSPRRRGPAEFPMQTYDKTFAQAEAAARARSATLEQERQEAQSKVPEILAQQTADGRGLAL